MPNEQQPNKTNVFKAFVSALAAIVGVQSRENLDRDFSTHKPMMFIAVGLVATLMFIATLVGVVAMVL